MSDWTTDTLKEALFRELEELRKDIDRRFAAQQKEVETAFNAAKEAVIKSEVGVEKRSDAVYVTIAKLTESLAAVMPRSEAEQRFSSVNDKIDQRLSALSDKIDELKASRDETAGGKKVSDLTMGKIYAAIAAVGTLLGIIILLANGKLG